MKNFGQPQGLPLQEEVGCREAEFPPTKMREAGSGVPSYQEGEWESGMGRPSLLETAIKEWGLVRDEVLDIHTAVFGRRSFGNAFVSAVVEYCDILLTEKSPEWCENYWQIITEIKRLRELAVEMQDEKSDFMRGYAVKIEVEYDLSDEN